MSENCAYKYVISFTLEYIDMYVSVLFFTMYCFASILLTFCYNYFF